MPRYIGTTNTSQITAGSSFGGSNQTVATLYNLLKSMGGTSGSAPAIFSVNDVYARQAASGWSTSYFAPSVSSVAPTTGGVATINGNNFNYDYRLYNGDQTISSWTNTDWFTTAQDTRSAMIYVNGNLTINSGVTIQPSQRKLFTAIYVKGNLTLNGQIAMDQRGANHSGSGNSSGAVTSYAIKLLSGTYGGYTDPTIPATGGTGGSRWGPGNGVGSPSAAPGGTPNFGTGGGASGGAGSEYGRTAVAGAGSPGTAFSGGASGGSSRQAYIFGDTYGSDATTNGGQGGSGSAIYYPAGAGSGNPAGSPAGAPYGNVSGASDGTGGVVVIYVEGTLSGSGTVVCRGAAGATPYGGGSMGSSGSGGGMATIFCATDSSTVSLSAAPGDSTYGPYASGTGFTAKITGFTG